MFFFSPLSSPSFHCGTHREAKPIREGCQRTLYFIFLLLSSLKTYCSFPKKEGEKIPWHKISEQKHFRATFSVVVFASPLPLSLSFELSQIQNGSILTRKKKLDISVFAPLSTLLTPKSKKRRTFNIIIPFSGTTLAPKRGKRKKEKKKKEKKRKKKRKKVGHRRPHSATKVKAVWAPHFPRGGRRRRDLRLYAKERGVGRRRTVDCMGCRIQRLALFFLETVLFSSAGLVGECETKLFWSAGMVFFSSLVCKDWFVGETFK